MSAACRQPFFLSSPLKHLLRAVCSVVMSGLAHPTELISAALLCLLDSCSNLYYRYELQRGGGAEDGENAGKTPTLAFAVAFPSASGLTM